MPFWQHVQRCEHCKFWQRNDPSSPEGVCSAEWAMKHRPFWAEPRQLATRWDEGTACTAYKHDSHKPHPLDRAREYLLTVDKGDKLPMRSYRVGEVDHATAVVVSRNQRHLIVQLFNGTHRLRIDATDNHRGGTIMGMEEWGIDTEQPIEHVRLPTEHPERAAEQVAAMKPGDTIHLIGYPPFRHVRKTAKVHAVTDKYVTIRIDRYRRKSKMHAAGPLVGIIEGELFALDTTGE